MLGKPSIVLPQHGAKRICFRTFASNGNSKTALSLGALLKQRNKKLSPAFKPYYETKMQPQVTGISSNNSIYNELEKALDTSKIKYAEYSIKLNQMLRETSIKNAEDKKFSKHLFESYSEYKLYLTSAPKINELHIKDVNTFVNIFIKIGQLKKAHSILGDLIELDPSLIHGENRDIESVGLYLKLRCGSNFSSWNADIGYRAFDTTYLYNLVEYTLKHNVSYWDEEICHGLGFIGSLDILDRFILRRWGVTLQEDLPSIATDVKEYPRSEIVASIVDAYCFNLESGLVKSSQILDKFINNYPSLNLNINFWRSLMSWSIAINNEHSKTNYIESWKTMKHWYTIRNKNIPFDFSINEKLYDSIRKDNNLICAIDVYQCCFHKFFQDRNFISNDEWFIIYKYQKFIIRRLINKKKYVKSNEFIDQWSITPSNKASLNEFQSYLTLLKKDKEINKVKKTYDEMVDEDMIIGRLW